MSNPAQLSTNVALDAVDNKLALDGPHGPRPKPFFTTNRVILYSILFVACLYYLFPLYVMVMTSFKTMPEIRFGNIFAPPREVTACAWRRKLRASTWWRWANRRNPGKPTMPRSRPRSWVKHWWSKLPTTCKRSPTSTCS